MIHSVLKRLSYSSLCLLHGCPRKYYLTKLLNRREEDNEDLTFGKAVGIGIQRLLVGDQLDVICLDILAAWNGDIEDDSDAISRKKKTLWHALNAINVFKQVHLPSLLGEYEVATLNGKPAIELGFRIVIGSDYYYRGFVDVVLIHKVKRELLVLELKTTAKKYVMPSAYQNSSQGLGYSLICDYIAQQDATINSSSFRVLYLVFMTLSKEFVPMPFNKSHTQRAQWIQEMLVEVDTIELYDKNNCWPMHGEHCSGWGRDCDFLNVCTLSDNVLLAGGVAEPKEEKDEDFAFNISLIDLINSQLARQEVV